jgi:hypothetical protein
MNVLLMLLTLFAIICFATLQAFDLQSNIKDRKQHAKKVLWSNQVNFYANLLNSETHDGPVHFKQLPVPNDKFCINYTAGLCPNDYNIYWTSGIR